MYNSRKKPFGQESQSKRNKKFVSHIIKNIFFFIFFYFFIFFTAINNYTFQNES